MKRLNPYTCARPCPAPVLGIYFGYVFVYFLQHSITLELYIGYTNNLKRRLKEHNQKSNKSTNRKEGEWTLIYCEVYRTQADAIVREQKLKHHGSGKRELYKRLQNSLLPKTGAGSVA